MACTGIARNAKGISMLTWISQKYDQSNFEQDTFTPRAIKKKIQATITTSITVSEVSRWTDELFCLLSHDILFTIEAACPYEISVKSVLKKHYVIHFRAKWHKTVKKSLIQNKTLAWTFSHLGNNPVQLPSAIIMRWTPESWYNQELMNSRVKGILCPRLGHLILLLLFWFQFSPLRNYISSEWPKDW